MTIQETQNVNEGNEEVNDSAKSKSTILSIDLQLENNEISKIWKKIIKNNPNYFHNLLKDLDLSDNGFSKRKCIFCNKELTFEYFFSLNSSLTLGKAWDIWSSKKKIKFHCLNCDKDS
jgi:hypothetical protein